MIAKRLIPLLMYQAKSLFDKKALIEVVVYHEMRKSKISNVNNWNFMETILIGRNAERQLMVLSIIIVILFREKISDFILYLVLACAILLTARRFFLNYKHKISNRQFYLLPFFLLIWLLVVFYN